MKIASFFGHKDFKESKDIVNSIKNKIIDLIVENGIDTFYLGGYGRFDYCSAQYVSEIKKLYLHIKSFLVLTYLNKKYVEYEKEYIEATFDGTIYPPIENVPLRFAISKRNEWIINQSEFILFFVEKSWGGASRFLEYAIRKGKKFVNFGRSNY